jgi:truncated hemoglobin YjbI
MAGIYDAIGGKDGCRKLSELFYARVAHDRILKPLFPAHLRCAIEGFTAFLTQFLGGPCEYSERHWSPSLCETHLRFNIGQKQRDAWMKNMSAALDDIKIEEPIRAALLSFFQHSSAYLSKDSQQDVAKLDDPELAKRWNTQSLMEEAVAAIRIGNADRTIGLMESTSVRKYCDRDRAGLVKMLAVMSGSGNSILMDYVHNRLTVDPALARDVYARGRTLLHAAAGAGNLRIVQLLLSLGADPNATDDGGHTPLYSAGNECRNAAGGDVVRALAQAGANVNIQNGVKQCSALHMAARRGNVAVADALLECGADIEARDSMGESPLRRAVNCGKIDVAALLVAKGADAYSKGSKGKSAHEAARSDAMKRVLGAT